MFLPLLLATLFSVLYGVESRPSRRLLAPTQEAQTLIDSGSSIGDGRTKYDIIQSCVFTILACVWTSVHPNIAHPQDSGWKLLKRRIVTMIYALIAPEAVVIWALRQNIAAERIANRYNAVLTEKKASSKQRKTNLHKHIMDTFTDIKISVMEWFTDLPIERTQRHERQPWTKTHGHFIQMGGFVLYEEGTPSRVLSYQELIRLRREKAIHDPIVTERDIKDRTKSNTLSKVLVVLQTTWFTMQCAVRWWAGLPLTELEVITLGFAVLNAVIYYLWWNKPQDVDIGIAIPLLCQASHATILSFPLKETDEQLENGALIFTDNGYDGAVFNKSQDHLDIPSKLQPQPANILYRCISRLLQPFNDMLSCRKLPTGAGNVPDFFAADKGIKERWRACAIGCTTGAIFGALHALAWISAFPTELERVFWRISTITIIAEPLLMLVVGFLYHLDGEQEAQGASLTKALQQLFSVAFGLAVPLYILSRFALITLAFASLRALPQGAFETVKWSTYIPHL